MDNRLRFNALVRLFFSAIMIELDRPGMGWRRGKYKGDLPECNPRIVKFAFDRRFELFMEQAGIKIPVSLKEAQHYVENRSETQGSPRM